MDRSGEREDSGDVVIACTLAPEELRARRATVLRDMRKKMSRITETAPGFVLAFDDTATREELDELIEFERGCCSFMKLSLRGVDGSFELTAEGPPGAKEFIQAELLDVLDDESACGSSTGRGATP
jgi:hypothetical protein